MQPMTAEDYASNIRAVIASARHMRAADPSRPSRAWFEAKYDPARHAENQVLYTYALSLGYDLAVPAPAAPLIEPPAPQTPATQQRRQPARMMQFLTRNDIFARPDPRWLIKGLLVENAFSIVYAQSKSFKSYLVLNIAGQLATGGEFFDGQALRQTGVVSIVLEGAHGMRSRIDAWETHHGRRLDPAWFRQVEDWQNLMDEAEVQNLVDNLRLLVEDGFPLGMVIIDTASKALGGGDTLNHADACKFCESCIRLQREFGCSVILVHHSGKDEDAGIIGSNAWLTQPDCVIKVERPDKDALAVKVVVEKQKAAPDGQVHKMLARVVDLDTDIGGDLVLLPDDLEPRLSKLQALQRDADDVRELALAMGAAERVSMNKLCLMSKLSGGRFRVVNSKTYDMIRRIVPEGEKNARLVLISETETVAIWRDDQDHLCKQSRKNGVC